MRIDDVNTDLKNLGKIFFALVIDLGGAPPTMNSGWYRTKIPNRRPLYLRFIGERAKTYPKNSVHLSTAWDESFTLIKGVTKGNNWYGSKPSADIFAQPDHLDEVTNAREFIRRAFGVISANAPEPAQERATYMSSEQEVFPFGDCIKVNEFAKKYWELISANEATEERRFERDLTWARRQGFLPKELFIRVSRWKSVRHTQKYESNSVESVRTATEVAFRATNDKSALASLMRLNGIALRTASAILHWMRPDHYPILDFRVVKALGLAEPTTYENFDFYSKVATMVRDLAQQCDINLRTIDQALWTWDKLQSQKRE